MIAPAVPTDALAAMFFRVDRDLVLFYYDSSVADWRQHSQSLILSKSQFSVELAGVKARVSPEWTALLRLWKPVPKISFCVQLGKKSLPQMQQFP